MSAFKSFPALFRLSALILPSDQVTLIFQCNVPCGNGTQRRDVICVQKTGNDFTAVPSAECAHVDKPAAVQECEMGDCQPQWFTTEWSAVRRKHAREMEPMPNGNGVVDNVLLCVVGVSALARAEKASR